MQVPIYHIDAFTNVPFGGNPAGVCLLDEKADPVWMQQIAKEMNLSETAFLHREDEYYSLRWFTPVTEVELCGHATLAAAHVLWLRGDVNETEEIRFHTLSGTLTARKVEDWIELNFPVAKLEAADLTDRYLVALGISPDVIMHSDEKILIEVADETIVRKMKPDFSALLKLPGRGIIVTAVSETPGIDFVSRYFAPWVGINEDPVTGSAHCMLAPYWQKKLAKNYLTAYQASTRGGILKLRLSGERVYISGQAVTVMQGTVSARTES